MSEKIILDLGCGTNKHRDSTGIDRVRVKSVDIVADLDRGIPVRDSSVDGIIASHFLEHTDDFLSMVEEMHRVSRNGAILKIRVPYFMCFDAYTDPTHRHFFTERAFDYFADEIYYNYYSKARFKILRKELVLNPNLRNRILSTFIPKKYLKAIFDVYNEVVFELQAIK
ncbi:MAG TPA: class I SAM-dependent methyltransferase [Candidatus Methanoperedenaceae archaeon]|nr:class I SAM-dependent methyltransferase [Candidatus Methanoperedenaceae archaeon]